MFSGLLQATSPRKMRSFATKTAEDENEVANDGAAPDQLKIGVFMEPKQHIQMAMQMEHPMDTSMAGAAGFPVWG